MGRRRKFYIPYTRSGSSMLASVIVQAMHMAREEAKANGTYKPMPWGWILFIAFILTMIMMGGK